MQYLNTVVISQYVPSYNAFEESSIRIHRPYCLTHKGAQRMINKGVWDKDGYPEIHPRQGASVVRVEHASFSR